MNQHNGLSAGNNQKTLHLKKINHVIPFHYSVIKYHNESTFVLQDKYKPDYEQKKVQIKKNKTD